MTQVLFLTLLVVFAQSFKATVDPFTGRLWSFTSGATPADLFAARMVREPFLPITFARDKFPQQLNTAEILTYLTAC